MTYIPSKSIKLITIAGNFNADDAGKQSVLIVETNEHMMQLTLNSRSNNIQITKEQASQFIAALTGWILSDEAENTK